MAGANVYGVVIVHILGMSAIPTGFTFHRNHLVQTRAVFQKGLAMSDRERRNRKNEENNAGLRAGLSKEQLTTLHTMEQFQWELRFVRRPLFQAPVPVLFNRDGTRYVVLEADGSTNENPGFKIRP